MKIKLFFLLAALLLSVIAYAQSGETPLKGDVNEDGVVDVADINAVISIMKNGGGIGEETTCYFSIGTTPVTVENYTTANNATTTIPTTQTFVNESGSKAAIYVLVPSDKTIIAEDMSIPVPMDMLEDTSVSIPNHKVYKSVAKIAVGGGLTVTLVDTAPPTYYFSIGTTEVTSSNYTIANNATTIIPTSTTYASQQRNYHYILIPSNKTLTVVDNSDNAPINFTEQTSISINNHKVYKTGPLNVGGVVKITLSDLYFSIGTTPVTADNYTTVNNATTTIPTITTFENNSGSKAYIYILVPSDKTVIIPYEIIEDTSVSIPNHKVYKSVAKIAVGGRAIVRISD